MFAILFNKCFCCPRLNPFVFNCGSFYSLSAKISRNENQKISTDRHCNACRRIILLHFTRRECRGAQEATRDPRTQNDDNPYNFTMPQPKKFSSRYNNACTFIPSTSSSLSSTYSRPHRLRGRRHHRSFLL